MYKRQLDDKTEGGTCDLSILKCSRLPPFLLGYGMHIIHTIRSMATKVMGRRRFSSCFVRSAQQKEYWVVRCALAVRNPTRPTDCDVDHLDRNLPLSNLVRDLSSTSNPRKRALLIHHAVHDLYVRYIT